MEQEQKLKQETQETKKEARREEKEIPQEALDYFDGDDLRARCFTEKYALEDEEGNLIETHPREMWHRVAGAMASVEEEEEKWKENFYWLLSDFKFVPGGRILFGAENPREVTLTNCYFTAIEEDSLEGIFNWCRDAALTYSRGGGNGVDIGILRPRGAPVNNAARTSSGAASFMEIFSTTTGTIGQHGRRGALMISCPVWHPDVEEFIEMKAEDLDSVRFANISVKVSDDFMEAVQNGDEFTLYYENEEGEYKEEDGYTDRIEKTVDARELWDKIITSAHASAEPGVLFWDNVKHGSPSEYCAPVQGTNPCGEQPLESNGACTLGHVNLAYFVEDAFTEDASVDWEGIERAAKTGVRFLDDVVEYNLPMHALEAQAEQAKKTRRVGLGVTGLGDMLAKLMIKYDTDEAIEFVDELMEKYRNWAYEASIEIAEEKEPFPLFDAEKHLERPFIRDLPEHIHEGIREHGLRNVCILTVAPVGSGSVLTGTSSGIEPIFSLKYQRRSESLSQEWYEVDHHLVQEYVDATGDTSGDIPDFFVTAHDIDPFFRVKMQATFQDYVDSSISSTVNLPKEIDVDTVKDIYQYAWDMGCKGMTVYREGSREGILITDEEEGEESEDMGDLPEEVEDLKRAIEIRQAREDRSKEQSTYYEVDTAHGPLHLHINYDQFGPTKVFANISPTGTEISGLTTALGILLSKYFELGGDPARILKHLNSIKSDQPYGFGPNRVDSIPHAVSKALRDHLAKTGKLIDDKGQKALPIDGSSEADETQQTLGEDVQQGVQPENMDGEPMKVGADTYQSDGGFQPDVKCPECHSRNAAILSGCKEPTCFDCGFSECG